MTLYDGQKVVNNQSQPKSGLLFDELTRKQANQAIKDHQAPADLVGRLIDMSHSGSYQASYFLGRFVMEEMLQFPKPEENNDEISNRGDAGPGFIGEICLGPYAFIQQQQFDSELPQSKIGPHGDPYEDYNQ